MNYYLVSYVSSSGGFGNIFFKSGEPLNIVQARKTISKINHCEAVIISINNIEESQFNDGIKSDLSQKGSE